MKLASPQDVVHWEAATAAVTAARHRIGYLKGLSHERNTELHPR